MAALRVNEDSTTGKLTLQSPLLPRLGNIAFGLVWLGFLALFFLLPVLNGDRVDWSTLLFLLIFLVVTVGSSLWTALTTTTVTIDRNSRQVTNAVKLLVFPLRSINSSFTDLTNIEVQYYRQSSGRASHDAWRVNAVGKDGKRLPLNWNGRQAEMNDLAQKIVALTGAPLLDSSTKPESAFQTLRERMRPQPETAAPAEAPVDVSPKETPQPYGEMTQTDQTTEAPPPEPSAPPVAAPYTMPMAEMAEPTAMTDTSTETASTPTVDLQSLSTSELEKRIQDDTMDSDARYVLARKYYARNQIDRAIALYQETLRLDPSNTGAQNDLGVALQQRGKRTEAEAAYRRAIALDPFSSTVHLNLALLLRAMNRAAEASQEFYQARQNARGDDERRAAETASSGAKMDPVMSRT